MMIYIRATQDNLTRLEDVQDLKNFKHDLLLARDAGDYEDSFPFQLLIDDVISIEDLIGLQSDRDSGGHGGKIHFMNFIGEEITVDKNKLDNQIIRMFINSSNVDNFRDKYENYISSLCNAYRLFSSGYDKSEVYAPAVNEFIDRMVALGLEDIDTKYSPEHPIKYVSLDKIVRKNVNDDFLYARVKLTNGCTYELFDIKILKELGKPPIYYGNLDPNDPKYESRMHEDIERFFTITDEFYRRYHGLKKKPPVE